MAYADTLRAATATNNTAASLIEGIISSGFPLTFSTWSPTLAATGSMTFTGTTITKAKYFQFGKLVALTIQATGTTGGTASNGITFTLPVTAADAYYTGSVFVYDPSDSPAQQIGYLKGSSTTLAICYKGDSTNYNLAAGQIFNCTMLYEAA